MVHSQWRAMAGFRYWGPSSASALRLVLSTTQWPYQEPKLEVPTIYIESYFSQSPSSSRARVSLKKIVVASD